MIDNLRSYLEGASPSSRANRLREYLQWLILRSLDTHGFRKSLAFVGGTALRLIYGTNRFSEDLDFSLVDTKDTSFRDIIKTVQTDLRGLGLEASASPIKDEKTVWSCFLRFAGLLRPLGLTTNPNQKLSVKIEVDANPPQGAIVEEFFFNGPIMLSVNHHDLASLFAGKIHALLFRKYTKGRDYYDLMHFLSKRTPFNTGLLSNAARQTNPEVPLRTPEDALKALALRLDSMDERAIAADCAAFLLQPDEIRYITKDNLRRALRQNVDEGVFR